MVLTPCEKPFDHRLVDDGIKKTMPKTIETTKTVRPIVSGVHSFGRVEGVGTEASGTGSGTGESIELFFILYRVSRPVAH